MWLVARVVMSTFSRNVTFANDLVADKPCIQPIKIVETRINAAIPTKRQMTKHKVSAIKKVTVRRYENLRKLIIFIYFQWCAEWHQTTQINDNLSRLPECPKRKATLAFRMRSAMIYSYSTAQACVIIRDDMNLLSVRRFSKRSR